MAIGIEVLMNAVISAASASGQFTLVQGHEPKSMPSNGPGNDLHLSVFLTALAPATRASGLAATTARVELTARMHKPFMSQPEDAIDITMANAVDKLFEIYSEDFDLGGSARNIDLLGAHGTPLSCRAGYQTVDGNTYRTLDIVIPIIVNDVWIQES